MVRVQKKSTRQNHRYEPERPAFPAQWFYGLYVLSLVTRLCCHRHQQIASADLAPALGRQDHTISPSASHHSSDDASRPSHPAPHVRDDRDTLLLRVRDGKTIRLILANREAIYFCVEDWTGFRASEVICPSGTS
jgi:hypothetical protein